MKKETIRQLSEGGGSTRNITSPPPIGNHRGGKSYLNKRIMPNECAVCTIGIGTSMQLIDGTWQQYNHMCKKAKKYRVGKIVVDLCDVCYEDLMKIKNKKKYLIKRGALK